MANPHIASLAAGATASSFESKTQPRTQAPLRTSRSVQLKRETKLTSDRDFLAKRSALPVKYR